MVLCPGKTILPEHLPPAVVDPGRGALAANAVSTGRTLAEVESAHIRHMLEQAGGNKTLAAKTLGISSVTLWRKLKAMADRSGFEVNAGPG